MSLVLSRSNMVRLHALSRFSCCNDIISLADLHPLALEDVLHQRGHARSKADYYHQHLYLRILCHALAGGDEGSTESVEPMMSDVPRSYSPGPMSEEEEEVVMGGGGGVSGIYGSEGDEEQTMYGESAPISRMSTKRSKIGILKRRPFTGAGWGGSWGGDIENAPALETKHGLTKIIPRVSTVSIASYLYTRFGINGLKARRKRVQDEKTIEELKKGERVNVKISPMSIFLLRDGMTLLECR